MGKKCRFFFHVCANSHLAQSVTVQLHLVLRLLQVTSKYELVSTENQSPSQDKALSMWGFLEEIIELLCLRTLCGK